MVGLSDENVYHLTQWLSTVCVKVDKVDLYLWVIRIRKNIYKKRENQVFHAEKNYLAKKVYFVYCLLLCQSLPRMTGPFDRVSAAGRARRGLSVIQLPKIDVHVRAIGLFRLLAVNGLKRSLSVGKRHGIGLETGVLKGSKTVILVDMDGHGFVHRKEGASDERAITGSDGI